VAAWNLDLDHPQLFLGDTATCVAWTEMMKLGIGNIDCDDKHLSKIFHPDKNKDCQATATKIFSAYRDKNAKFCKKNKKHNCLIFY
jgi:hypothetical protein